MQLPPEPQNPTLFFEKHEDNLMPQNPIIQQAINCVQAGISVIPVRPGSKQPAIPWKQYQHAPADLNTVIGWFTQHPDWGLGVVCGQVSGNLEMLELEGRAADLEGTICDLADASGLGDLAGSILYQGWTETTPSGGIHYYYRTTEPVAGNTQLAKQQDGAILAETRGEGGFVVIAPTDGTHHETGRGWEPRTGGPTHMVTLSPEEHEALWSLFRAQNQHPEKPEPLEESKTTDTTGGVRPGDDYEARTSWAQILEPHGWKALYTAGSTTYWRRPGKNTGVSATTGHAGDRDRLYVFTTSTIFQTETPYTKFGAYTLLNHGGDHEAAAKALAADGYGKQPEHRRDTSALDEWTRELQTNQQTTTTATESEPAGNDAPKIYEPTEDGNALRYADTYAGQLLYILEHGAWAAWDGHVWNLENGDQVAVENARRLVRALPAETKQEAAWRKKSQARSNITNTISLASNTKGMYANMTKFDTNPWLLNTPNGIVDLTSGEISDPDPATLCLRSTNCGADPNMATPVYDRFMDQTFMSDTALIQYVQKIFGLTLIGEVKEQLFLFFHGVGANGKSTLLELYKHILGTGDTGYATVLPAEAFLTNAGNRHPAEIAKLAGARLAVTSETEEGQHFAEARVKQLTGADTISARFMRQDWFDFTPSHTLIMVSNHEPDVSAGGQAFWRRIRKIPFNYVVPEKDRDPNLLNKLIQESPGILWKTILATIDYHKNGIGETPAAVLAATREYESEQDTVKMYIQECCKIGNPNQQGYSIKVAEFRQEYETWCRINDFEPVGSKTLTQRMKAYGVESCKSGSVRYYAGVRVEISQEIGIEGGY